jgi:hypothetical protein
MNITTRAYTATLLDDGRVLVVGSLNGVPTAEIYDPSPQCVTFQRGSFGTTADTQIGAASPTKNYGTSTVANSGLVGGSTRQTLLSFDLSPIPAGSRIDSAALTVHENATSGATSAVDVHRITAAWAETTVTWSSFAGAYNPTVEATFLSGVTPGSRTVDITGVVQGWRSGATTNNGVLLAQPSATTFTSYNTGEATPASTRPALAVCFVAP